MSRGLAFGLAAVLASAVAGCGGATKSEDDVANVSQAAAVTSDGRLTEPAKPLRLADLRREPEGSPQETLLRLFYWAQWGSAPNIATAYDPTIRKTLGVANIVGAYSQRRASLATSRPRFIEITKSSTGTFVAVELLRADARPARHSFLLRRRDGRLRIVFDTLLEESLANYVASVQSRNPVDKLPDRAAVLRGRATAQVYRSLFAATLDR